MQPSPVSNPTTAPSLLLLLLTALIASACSAQPQSNPASASPPAAPAHHRGDTFQNNYLEFAPRGLFELMQWQWRAHRQGLPLPPALPTPTVAPDLPFITRNATAGRSMEPAVTWIGHATVLAQVGGLNMLTDPIFSERASPLSWLGPQRAQPPGLALAQLPHIDLVVISHNHYDHCDEASLLALNQQRGGPPLFIVPLRMKAWMASIGIQHVVELDWWQSHKLGDVEVVMTPVQHWSGRSLTDRMKNLWGGYAVFAPQTHLFFAGDTGYSKDFKDVRERFAPRQKDGGFDIALIPVGAYEPRWFMEEQHVDPTQSVQMHLDLGARTSLGIHWGTFNLTDESLDTPPVALSQALKKQNLTEADFFVLAIGETRRLPRRPASPP